LKWVYSEKTIFLFLNPILTIDICYSFDNSAIRNWL